MIFVGLDDTDAPDQPGTNQLAKALAAHLAARYRCRMILRHQLLRDPRIPMTSKNSAATLLLELQTTDQPELPSLCNDVAKFVASASLAGSDPGICIGTRAAPSILQFGRHCQRCVTSQREARELAARCGLFLKGLGGSQDGVIGALAAVGLAASGNDGRVVMLDQRDDLSGRQPIPLLLERHIRVQCVETGAAICHGSVEVGKHLRPNYRAGHVVLFAERLSAEHADDGWEAVRLP